MANVSLQNSPSALSLNSAMLAGNGCGASIGVATKSSKLTHRIIYQPINNCFSSSSNGNYGSISIPPPVVDGKAHIQSKFKAVRTENSSSNTIRAINLNTGMPTTISLDGHT